MKDEKAKYLMVTANEIDIKTYTHERVADCNDWFSIYREDGIIKATEIFEKNKVPMYFQKLIVKINIPSFIGPEGEEYLLGTPFDLTGRKIEKINNERYINASSSCYYNLNVFENYISFKTKLKKVEYKTVVNFIKELQQYGCLEAYIKSLKEILNIKYMYFYPEKYRVEQVLRKVRKNYESQ